MDAITAGAWSRSATPETSLASTEPALVTIIWVVVIITIFAPLGTRRYRSMSR